MSRAKMESDEKIETEQTERRTESRRILVYKKDTWGSYGQHDLLFVIVIDPSDLSQKLIFDKSLDLEIMYERNDSRKNIHREAHIDSRELAKLEQKILKFVRDYKSSSRRRIDVEYYAVINGELVGLKAETSKRDSKGFFDRVYLPDGRVLKVRKESIEVEQ